MELGHWETTRAEHQSRHVQYSGDIMSVAGSATVSKIISMSVAALEMEIAALKLQIICAELKIPEFKEELETCKLVAAAIRRASCTTINEVP